MYETELVPTTLEPRTLALFTRELFDRAGDALAGSAPHSDCLDALLDLLSADRGLMVLVGPRGTRQLFEPKDDEKRLRPAEREEVCKSALREAFDARRCVAVSRGGSGATPLTCIEGRATAALAAPLFFGRDCARAYGAVYVDSREDERLLDDTHVKFFLAGCSVIASVLEQSEQVWPGDDRGSEPQGSEVRIRSDARGPPCAALHAAHRWGAPLSY